MALSLQTTQQMGGRTLVDADPNDFLQTVLIVFPETLFRYHCSGTRLF
jgi:hypothetical protein